VLPRNFAAEEDRTVSQDNGTGGLRVAIVGSGPAGVYAADALLKQADSVGGVEVDILDRLPAPYGLVRYGVAPDHLKIKSIALALKKVFEKPGVRFIGNVELGRDVSIEDLQQTYDAVIVASGAAVDRRLGIDGEDLPGSFSATDFVAWYSGHPDAALDAFTLGARSVVVVGVGNVAVDVARILAKTVDELKHTDLPDHVLNVLDASTVTDIHMLGRRGPVQAKFTTKELRELGELADADVIVHADELQLDAGSEEALAGDATLRRNLEVLREWSTRTPQGKSRRIHLRFLVRPVDLHGEGAVTGVTVERTALDGSGGVHGTGETFEIDAQMVLRSVGYKGIPVPGLPFDDRGGVVPHDAGRVMQDGVQLPGLYVAGWIKRGPTGVVGTNKGDATETVASLFADADKLPRAPERNPQALLDRLAAQHCRVVLWEGWCAIDEAEMALGRAQGRDRVKIAELEAMLVASGWCED
jgi:ferredoxin--NADP+ reductase